MIRVDVERCTGASAAVKLVMELCISDGNSGVLIPIPQYPLYTATLTRRGGVACGYFLKVGREGNGMEGKGMVWNGNFLRLRVLLQETWELL